MHRFRHFFILAFSILGLYLVSVSDLGAQGCAMCKTAATAQSEQATRSLNRAIIVLLTPPVTIMSFILLFAFRCRNTPRSSAEAHASSEEEAELLSRSE